MQARGEGVREQGGVQARGTVDKLHPSHVVSLASWVITVMVCDSLDQDTFTLPRYADKVEPE